MRQDALQGPHPPGAGACGPGQETVAGRVAAGALRRRLLMLGAAGFALPPRALWAAQPGQGVPLGLSLRTDRHIATLIQSREPSLPSLHRDGSRDRFRIHLLLVPLDGGAPRLLAVKGGLPAPAIGLGKVLGSDGRHLWFDVAGLGAVDLASHRLLTPAELARADPRSLPRPWGGSPLPPRVEHHLAAGLMTTPTTWLGLHADAEQARDFRPGQWIRPVVRADSARVLRRFYQGRLQPDATVGRPRIVALQPLGDAAYLGAALLRPADTAEPLRLQAPAGALMLYSSGTGAAGTPGATTVLARVDEAGRLLWRVDTGIERFRLQQILPGPASTAFVGPRPPVPGRLSEPLLVIVEHASGQAATHSLWR
jgi:hypothetical protein